MACGTRPGCMYERHQTIAAAHLDGLAGQLEEVGRDGHHAGVLRVKRSQERRRLTVEVLLIVDEALGEEGHVALVEIVDHATLATVLLHERHPQLVALDRVQHLQVMGTGNKGGVVNVRHTGNSNVSRVRTDRGVNCLDHRLAVLGSWYVQDTCSTDP